MSLTLTTDRTGYPMIRSDALGVFVHWLPVTKLQLEWFLCDQPSNRFNQEWYERILGVHKSDPGRVSAALVTDRTYYRALATGLTPGEVEPFANWLARGDGGQYELPTHKEWKILYDEFAAALPIELSYVTGLTDGAGKPRLTARTRALVERMNQTAMRLPGLGSRGAAAATPSLADQMLMRNGVMEWVQWRAADRHQDFGGRGYPYHDLVNNRRDFTLEAGPHDPGPRYADTDSRLRGYGFRLIRRS